MASCEHCSPRSKESCTPFASNCSTSKQPTSPSLKRQGLVSVTLPAALRAVARADLGDVVDRNGLQWPYLAGGAPLLQQKQLLVAQKTENKRSRYELRDEFAPMRVHRISFDTDAPYVERTATLLAIDQKGQESLLATNRLSRRSDARAPFGLEFAPALAHALAW